jgi:hypothetical protein
MDRGVSVKQDAGRRSPKQINNQIRNAQAQQAGRMSHVGNPAVSNSQLIINRGSPLPSLPPMPPNRQHPQSPELVSGAVEESALCGIRGSCVSYIPYLECLSSMIPMPQYPSVLRWRLCCEDQDVEDGGFIGGMIHVVI